MYELIKYSTSSNGTIFLLPYKKGEESGSPLRDHVSHENVSGLWFVYREGGSYRKKRLSHSSE